MPNFKIRTCTQEDIGMLTETIRKAFRDVAERFGLTPDNTPHHPSTARITGYDTTWNEVSYLSLWK
jgi:hypothetical protein